MRSNVQDSIRFVPEPEPRCSLRHAARSAVFMIERERKLELMSEHHKDPKPHEAHALHEEHTKGPHDPKEINPKLASDIAFWAKEFKVSGEQLHEAIRSHGTHVDKVRAALHTHGTV